MKKIFILILAFLFLSMNDCFAISELYYLKNIKTTTLKPAVENAFTSQNFRLQAKDPYYGISNKDNSTYAITILQQSGENMFYYYQSEDNSKINKQILKEIKNLGVICEQSYNANLLDIYGNLATKLLNNQNLNTYTFENTSTTAGTATANKSNSTLSGYVAQVKKGTKFGVYLKNPIDTSTAAVGDEVIAVLTSNWTYNNRVIAQQGSLVYGTIKKAHGAQYASRNGRVVMTFKKLVTTDGKSYNISTENVDFTVSNDGKFGQTVKNVAVGAAVGAVTGLLTSAIWGGGSYAKYSAISAGVGAGTAMIGTVAQKGIDAEIPAFTELELTLSQPFSVTLSN